MTSYDSEHERTPRTNAQTRGAVAPAAGHPGARRHVLRTHPRRLVAAGAAALLAVGLVPAVTATSAEGVQATVGQGFTVTPSDLAFILKQIKISERHSRAFQGLEPTQPANPNPTGDPLYCQSLVGSGTDQVPDRLTSYGLRTVDGQCNNLFVGRETYNAADVTFPRLTTARYRAAEGAPAGFFGPGSPAIPSTSYAQKLAGNTVVDSQPRLISNLIVDQTSTNPAAVQAAGFPVRTQGNTGIFPCAVVPGSDPPVDVVPATPDGCVPARQTLEIPNVTTDVGLSPPYNSLFTFFGQFFDHGVDQTVKSGGSVVVPLRADDPLIAGADHNFGQNCGTPEATAGCLDNLPVSLRFMAITRAQNQPGDDGVLGTSDDVQDTNNTDTPLVDQSQTYTSHASHQAFLREYVSSPAGRDGILVDNPATLVDETLDNGSPVSTGRLLGGLGAGLTYTGSPDGRTGISTWASTKKQAHDLLGLRLVDSDVTNIPMLLMDPYGTYIGGPHGLPQYVTTTGLVEGRLDDPGTAADETVPVPANVRYFDTPFLTDIAHNADPSAVDDDHNSATPKVFPVPDADTTPSANFAGQPAGTYDDEMLNAHFTCGDGRCNENIALTTVHQIFHSEHDRLVGYIEDVLTNDTSPTGVRALAEWKSATAPGGWNGERLFQAARFVTEMEYQHLVFEEFGRKIQPAIRPFHLYHADLDGAIPAEFAHAVYRFGHSMLNDEVARVNDAPVGTQLADNSLPLLTAFLNPPEYQNSGDPARPYTPEQAAGAVIMGSSDQIGNELDEFVVETLRNNLLGLPLDLATLNMTRARDAGIPPLNDVRRQIFNATNDGQLQPYTSWSDFGQHLKHPESLINFVASYGLHPTITAQSTMAGKRAAARAIVNPLTTDTPPGDAAEFMFSTDGWASDADGVTSTGLDNVDLWVGGLAEITNLFGGLLGTTFNYVFENSMANLQDGDRFYYLARTPGMNLRTQLEGNSFAELIQRNTDNTHTLKADAFATADCRFELGRLQFPAVAPELITGAGSVKDDPLSLDCNENRLLLRQPNGTIQYRQFNSEDPPGINGQAVYNGTSGVDRIFGGNDNDTFWGGEGNDRIEGNGGDDVALGGPGDDILTDLGGADVSKGGPGDDAIDTGIGDDLSMGGDGQDFINGGNNDNEHFAGPGNDFVIGGQGADVVFGDGGDDWIQGGSGQDLLIGDHAAPFFDDPAQAAPGNDVFVGQVGENDYDAEGGDDLMAQNAAIDRNAGSGGFDWAFHQYDTVGADDDMEINNNLVGLPIQVVVNRDRWSEVEANSGSRFNDAIKGNEIAPKDVTGAGFTGCNALDPVGVARISGLNALVGTFPTDLATVTGGSAGGYCPLVGFEATATDAGTVWGEGDILLGGGGSDTLTGRGADDIIDGDRELTVRISVRDAAGTEIGSTDLMEHTYQVGNTHTLQQDVFAGVIDPGNLVVVREIVTAAPAPADCGTALPVNCDTAVFVGPRSNYSIESVPASGTQTAFLRVTQTGADVVGQKVSEGVDSLRNIERLEFSDGSLLVAVPEAPTAVTATAGAARATVSFTFPSALDATIDSFTLIATPSTGPVVTIAGISRTARTRIVTGLVPGVPVTFEVRAVNLFGEGAPSAPSNAVTPTAPVVLVPPAAPTGVTAVGGNASATVTWTAPAPNGGPAVTSYEIVTTPATIAPITGIASGTTTFAVTGLANGTSYTFRVRAVNDDGTGPLSGSSNAVTPAVPLAPTAPTNVVAVGGNATATVSWTDGAIAVTGHSVQVLANGVLVRTVSVPGSATSTIVTALTNGTRYRFRVIAVNGVGPSPASGQSNQVVPATLPGAPVIGLAQRGALGGPVTAFVRWSAPASNGGSRITSYRVTALRFSNTGVLQSSTLVAVVSGTTLTRTVVLAAGNYQFTVVAVNAIGQSAASLRSNLVQPA